MQETEGGDLILPHRLPLLSPGRGKKSSQRGQDKGGERVQAGRLLREDPPAPQAEEPLLCYLECCGQSAESKARRRSHQVGARPSALPLAAAATPRRDWQKGGEA